VVFFPLAGNHRHQLEAAHSSSAESFAGPIAPVAIDQ